MIRADRAQSVRSDADDDRAASQSRSARQAVTWILALALAIFVLSYAISPKDVAEPGKVVDGYGRMEVVPGQAGP